jgi:hypothetical protein
VKAAGLWAAVVFFAVGSASAEEQAEGETPPAVEGGAPEPLPDIGQDQLAVFKLQRGFYFSSDLGVFLTFGGVNGNSNVQPYLSMKAGIDLGDFASIQASLSHGYSSGNPLSRAELPTEGGQGTINYGLMSIGGELVLALRPTSRFAIEPKIGGGLTFIYPQLTDPANPSNALSKSAPHVSGGLDFKYLTLLTDFTAGLSFTGYYILGPNIPALGTAFVVRYTF